MPMIKRALEMLDLSDNQIKIVREFYEEPQAV